MQFTATGDVRPVVAAVRGLLDRGWAGDVTGGISGAGAPDSLRRAWVSPEGPPGDVAVSLVVIPVRGFMAPLVL